MGAANKEPAAALNSQAARGRPKRKEETSNRSRPPRQQALLRERGDSTTATNTGEARGQGENHRRRIWPEKDGIPWWQKDTNNDGTRPQS